MMKKVGFFLAALVLALLLGEGGLRAIGISPGLSIANRLNPYQFDSTLGWTTRARTAFLRSSPEYLHYNYYDSEGLPAAFENRESTVDVDVPKVVLIGNSYVESYYVPYKKSFPHLLEQQLPSRKVLNLGVSGYTPAQYILQARRHLPRHKNIDRIFIFLVPYQDIRFLDMPLFPGGYPKPVFGTDLEQPTNLPLVPPSRRTVGKKHIEDYSVLITVLQPYLFKWLGYRNAIYDYPINYDQLLFSVDDFSNALRYSKQIQKEFGRADNVFTVYAPTEFEYLDDRISKNLIAFRSSCERLEIQCLVPPFVESPPSGDYRALYYPKDRHPSPHGAALIAEFLADFLKSHPAD